jgi:hypothetical protein
VLFTMKRRHPRRSEAKPNEERRPHRHRAHNVNEVPDLHGAALFLLGTTMRGG